MFKVEEILTEQEKLINKRNQAYNTLQYMKSRPNDYNKRFIPIFEQYIKELDEQIELFNGTLKHQGDLWNYMNIQNHLKMY